MSVEAVNNVSNNVPLNKQVEKPIEQTAPVEEEKKNGTALLLGSLAALAIGGGIYFATRGKKGTSEAGSSAEKPLEQIKEMAIDAFKQAGNRFEKGKALTADGTGYTGKLTQQLEDGKVIIREYKNGLLQAAKKMDGETILAGKAYEYDSFGLSKITDVNSSKPILTVDRFRTEVTYRTDKNIITVDNGNLYRPVIVMQNIEGYGGYYRAYCLRNGKYSLLLESPEGSHIETFYRENGTKWFSINRLNYTSLKVYDNEGKIVIDTSNPKTADDMHKYNEYHKEYVNKARNLEEKYLR